MSNFKAYLQKDGGEWFDDFVFNSIEPLKSRGFEIISFDVIDNPLEDYFISKRDIVIGSVDSCEYAFKEMGIEVPKYLGYPETLKQYLGRDVISTTKGQLTVDKPIFVKPKNEVKLFTGEVLLYENDIERIMGNLDDDFELYSSSLINPISEYRCSVNRNKLVGLKHYLGDFTVFPDVNLINGMIESFSKDSPKAYTLDVAVLESGETVLVEVNDYWALGSYGLDNRVYVNCYIDRWYEITLNL